MYVTSNSNNHLKLNIYCAYTPALLSNVLNLPYIILYIIGYHNTADKYKNYDWEIVEWQ